MATEAPSPWQSARPLLLRHTSFRHYWMGRAGSSIGDWFNEVAILQFAYHATGSPQVVGWLAAVRGLFSLGSGAFLGPFVDRFPKQSLLVALDLSRALVAGGFAVAFGLSSIPLLFGLAALLSTLNGMAYATESTSLPLIVREAELTEANGFVSSMYGFPIIIGALLGGYVSTAFSPAACFGINAASFVWAALHVRAARYVDDVAGAGRGDYFVSLRQGYREALHNRIVRNVILIGLTWGVAGSAYYIVIPFIGNVRFHLGALGIGAIYAVDGAGLIAGGLALRWISRRSRLPALVLLGLAYCGQAFFFGLFTAVTAVAGAFAALFAFRVFSGLVIPITGIVLQREVAAELRGRVFAFHAASYMSILQLGYVVAGLAIAKVGVSLTGIVATAMALAVAVVWTVRIGSLPDPKRL
jgi:predicted MFS family arabinose efflux permease